MRLFLKKIVMFAPVVFILILVNVAVDPAHIYRKGYEEKAASLLISGENVAGMTDHDERILQEEIIRKGSMCPNTIILGSSRVMTLSDEVVKNMGDYRNHGVSGAGIFDYLCILGIYKFCGKLPDNVIIGLDPWILNENNGDTRYRSIVKYIDEFRDVFPDLDSMEENISKSFSEKKLQILSISYFQNSVRFLLKNPSKVWDINEDVDFYGTKERSVDENIRYTDGSIEYQLEEREKNLDQVEHSAREYVKGEIYQIEGYDSLSEKYSGLLEGILDYLQKKGITVCFYLPPYHPYVYQYLEERADYGNVLRAERFFIHLAEKRGIDVYGSYDPKKVGCTEADFLDGMHLRRSSVGKAWKKLADDPVK